MNKLQSGLVALLAIIPLAGISEDAIYRCAGGEYVNNWVVAEQRNCKLISSSVVPPTTASSTVNAGHGQVIVQDRQSAAITEIASEAAQRGLGIWVILTIPVALIAAFAFSRRVLTQMRTSGPTDDLYEAAARELDGGDINKGLWARLYAEHNGDDSKTRAAYIKVRAKALANGA